jgi:hypothetical protein
MLKLNLVIKWVYNINLHVFMFFFFIPFILLLGSKYSLFNLSLMCLHFQDSRGRLGDGETESGKGKSFTNTEKLSRHGLRKGDGLSYAFSSFFFCCSF